MSEPLILGTAGHIDHGKTALVRALTGIDCDRLPEEQARGITIELGFAPLRLGSGLEFGVVDVPGHERLVRTMVAGATGIDLVLFVVAADEGIMPQSREHLAICDLLGIDRGVIALSKIDSVDADLLEMARLDVKQELAGSCLAGSPIVPVSALRGDGLDELRAALRTVASCAVPRTPREGPAWLPVDRVFTMHGFGTVVTGTLRGGAFEAGAMLDVLPAKQRQRLAARIRGLQVHGKSVQTVAPGSRCAVNLQGIDRARVPRGSVLATPGRLDYRPRLDVEMTLLPSAPPLPNGRDLSFHIGTNEQRARLRLLERPRLEPGEQGLAELRFHTPVVAVEGERFIVRGFRRIPNAGWTIGGGRVLDAAPSRSRRARTDHLADLRIFATETPAKALAARLERAGLRGMREEELLREVRSLEGIPGVRVGHARWLGRNAFQTLVEQCTQALRAHHRERPHDPWVGLAEITSRLRNRISRDAIRAALDRATRDGVLEAASRGHRLRGHSAHVADPDLEQRAESIFRSVGLAPPTLQRLSEQLDVPLEALRPICEHLEREGRLVRVSAGLYFMRAEIDALRQRVIAFLQEHEEIDPARYKQLTGQTRKFTVPLMEYFDTEKLTLRRGNLRVLRGR